MFDFDVGKLIVIGIVALIAIPSKDLPRVLRQLGQLTGKMRRMANEFQGQLNEAMREAELHEIQKEIKGVHKDLTDVAVSAEADRPFDPIADMRNHVVKAAELEKPPTPPALPEPEAPKSSVAKPSPREGEGK
jgi:sec-independent protein translocase protein TatB